MPCSRRCKQMEYCEDNEKIIESDDADNGWVDTHHYDTSVIDEKVSEMNIESQTENTLNSPIRGDMSNNCSGDKNKGGDKNCHTNENNNDDDEDDDDDDDEACDMDEFEKEGFPMDDDDEVCIFLIFQ